MDTLFWGPDCWKLLHNITQNYPINPTTYNKKKYKIFFNSIHSILPCVYCRISFKLFTKELPIDNYLDTKTKLCKWLYLIHNKVNNKLRREGQNIPKNPSFKSIYSKYECELNHYNIKPMKTPGIDFLYSIVFNYSFSNDNLNKKSYTDYIHFFKSLKYVIPFKYFKTVYSSYIKEFPISKNVCNDIFKLWIFGLDETYSKLFNLNSKCFNKTNKKYEQYKAKCIINTCRSIN